MREHGTGAKLEIAGFLVVDGNAGDVRGQKVRRALQPLHLDIDRTRQGTRQHGFAGAGHILQQHMPATEERDDSQLDDRPFADDDLLDVRDE